MPKRRSDDVEPPQRHLYVIFDDWSLGYSIRMVDLYQPTAAFVTGKDSTEYPRVLVRLEAPRGLPMYFAAAFGTKIMVMHPWDMLIFASKRHVPIVDVLEQGLILGPRPRKDHVDPIYILVGGTLYALAAGSFELLHRPPVYVPGSVSWEWSWVKLPKPPLESKYVTSYAVHPNGRTIFISMVSPVSSSTFTYDHRRAVLKRVKVKKEEQQEQEKENSEDVIGDDDSDFEATTSDDEEDDEEEELVYVEEASGWELHGQWTLPFTGRAHFDLNLDAWVGLDSDSIGHIGSCDAVSVDSHMVDLNRKLYKQKLFSEEPDERHVGATLLYLNGSNYCLVESIIKQDFDDERYLFRLVTFSLEYDKNGCLATGINSFRVGYCNVPPSVTELTLKNPVAFWM